VLLPVVEKGKTVALMTLRERQDETGLAEILVKGGTAESRRSSGHLVQVKLVCRPCVWELEMSRGGVLGHRRAASRKCGHHGGAVLDHVRHAAVVNTYII